MQLHLTLNNHTIQEVRKEVKAFNSAMLTLKEFELLEKLIEILSLFNKVTHFLSVSKYSTLGFMTLILEELARRLKFFTGQKEKAIL
ncbi:13734_t:CDS:1, partial [Acaulospora morrowiae]